MTTTTTQNLQIQSELQLLSNYSDLLSGVPETKATYVWLDGCNGLRSKVKTLRAKPETLAQIPSWMLGTDWYYSPTLLLGYEARLDPVRLYADPFAGGHHKIILCQTLSTTSGQENHPIPCNTRFSLVEETLKTVKTGVKFAVKQEYYLFEGTNRKQPLGWAVDGYPKEGGAYSYGVGAGQVTGRQLAEAHLEACLKAGVAIKGQSAGPALSTWSFEIDHENPVTTCDDLWMARYLLQRLAETYNIVVSFDGDLFPGTANRSEVEFSIPEMKNISGGINAVKSVLGKLKTGHEEFVKKATRFANYPYDEERRLNKKKQDEVAFDVVIREKVASTSGLEKEVVLVDRRVPSNLDPYVVCEQLVKAVTF